MILYYIIFKIICLASCFDAAMIMPQVSGRDHQRIPNPQEVLDFVFSRLERKRQAPKQVLTTEGSDCNHGEEQVPENIVPTESDHVRKLRKIIPQVPFQRHYPLCHLERTMRNLTTQDYEYRPAFYEEVKCVPKVEPYGASTTVNEICTSLGFSCIQLNKTIHLTRRRFDSDCWEAKTLVISAGCECMWPAHHLGDIKYHLGPL